MTEWPMLSSKTFQRVSLCSTEVNQPRMGGADNCQGRPEEQLKRCLFRK